MHALIDSSTGGLYDHDLHHDYFWTVQKHITDAIHTIVLCYVLHLVLCYVFISRLKIKYDD
jgi:hypothetical protein